MRIKLISTFVLFSLLLTGCGETIHGVGKDASRIYRGTKMIFVSED